jgi:hypothetical protein
MSTSKKCKFAKMCKYYSTSSFTCRFDEESSVYCGVYDLFDNYKSPEMEKIEKSLFTC